MNKEIGLLGVWRDLKILVESLDFILLVML